MVEPLPRVDSTQNGAAMHLDDLFGDGEPKARAALGLGKGAVDLLELFEDARLLGGRNAGTRVGYSNVEVPVYRFRRDTHLAGVGELTKVIALPTRLSTACVRRCSSPRPIRRDLATSVLSESFLFWASDSVAERTGSTTLSIAYSAMSGTDCPDSVLAN